jgi:prepilin-type N-terminal cleavage/methylation domain-containing protein
MLNINKKLSKKGFSLIELMVAIAILAMAIFGIFHAYSVGFMGMADARDRTVATNYVRETLEDIKNMDFLKIENTYFTTEEINTNGKIFTKSVHIDKIDDNLKKATSWVSWYNRNNKLLEVKNTMLIQNSTIKSDTGTAVKIVLYADPYYNVIPGGGIVNLTAVLKDQNGNILTKWDNTEDVSFSIIASTDLTGQTVQNLGSISPTVVTLNQGSASTVFTSGIENLLGYVTIQALVVLPDEGQLTDTVTLKITDSGVAIDLVANPQTILINVGTSNITATIVDSEGIKVPIATNLVTFSIDNPSLGILEGTNPVNAIEGTANITLKSTELPGTVRVSASATDLQTGTVEITTSEEDIVPTYISISAAPISIYINDPSTITVTIKDQYRNPLGFGNAENPKTIYLSLSPENGTIASSLVFTGESSKSTIFEESSSGTVTVTASGDLGGTVGVVSDSVTINIYDYPTEIILTASPESIKADNGISYSIVKATLVNSYGIKVPIADNSITFNIDSGPGTLEGTNPVKAVNGEAWITLRSTNFSGDVIVNASSGLINGTIKVITTGDPVSMSISANPSTINIYDKSTITVTIKDLNGNPVEFGNAENPKTIYLSLYPENGTIASSLVFTGESSKSTIFQPSYQGEVSITASGGGFVDPTPPIYIIINEPSLDFMVYSVMYYNENDIYFDFDIIVAGGTIEVTQMQILWEVGNSESLTEVQINGVIVFVGEAYYNSPSITITDYSLVSGEHHISFYFDTQMKFMKNKEFTVTFYTSSGHDYTINFYGPI